jgi:hypothetical protein
MPLVAAERPIRRIVMLNAVVPFPSKSFWEATQNQHVWANWATRLLATPIIVAGSVTRGSRVFVSRLLRPVAQLFLNDVASSGHEAWRE